MALAGRALGARECGDLRCDRLVPTDSEPRLSQRSAPTKCASWGTTSSQPTRPPGATRAPSMPSADWATCVVSGLAPCRESAQPIMVSNTRQAASHARHASAHTRQCPCMRACCTHSSAHAPHAAMHASSSARLTVAS